MQINARVWAAGRWRGLPTVGVRDSLGAINGMGHAAVMTDPGFRAALAVHGYSLDPETGEVAELVGYAGAFSARARQIEHNIDRYEAAAGSRRLPAVKVRQSVELAYATTVYGAQGETVSSCHVLVSEHTGASSAYVGMTRGRERNVAHLVAESVDDARRQWIDVFGRDRADLGPAHAAVRAAEDIERYGPKAPVRAPAAARRRRVEAVRTRRPEGDFGYRPPVSPPSRGVGF